MPIWTIETETGFDYGWRFAGWDPEEGGYWRWSFEGTDLDYAEDGALIRGTITDYTFSVENESIADGVSILKITACDINLTWSPNITNLAGLEIALLRQLISEYGDAPRNELGQIEPLAQITTLGTDFGTLAGSVQNDLMRLLGTEQVAKTGMGDDTVYATNSTGISYVNLGSGDDTFQGGAFEARVWGLAGNDTISGSTVQDFLLGGAGQDQLFGQAGDDELRGGGDSDILWGEAGNDVLLGGGARDVLIGGAGDDRLWGGAGSDAFVFIVDRFSHHLSEVGHTRIMDFDLSEDMLRIGPSYNGTWDRDDAFARFLAGAEAKSWGTVYREDDMHVYLLDVALEDLTAAHFVDGASAGSYGDWLAA